MYFIKPHSHADAARLVHGPAVFHEALEKGQTYYHVEHAPGGDYDLEYVRNNDLVPLNIREVKKGTEIYPPYLSYDENDTGKLDLALLKEHRAIVFESVNEYSVVLGRIALAHSEADLYYADARILDFLDRHERLHVAEEVPPLPEEQVLRAVDRFVSGVFEHNFHTLGTMPLFHSVFFWQSLTDRPFNELKYVCVGIAKNVGIGGVLSYYANAARLFQEKGLRTFLKKNASRYPDEMLHRYFCLQKEGADADENNTLFLEDLTSVTATYAFTLHSAQIDTGILSDSFRNELDEYADSVIGSKRALGVLIRGTDYIVSKLGGERQMATVDQMLPLMREWIREDHYEILFLATEDEDILDKMHLEFGHMLRVIAQERHRVADFTGGMKVLSDLEEAHRSEPDAQERVEDNTINYFYALYCLSKCESFMASGQCHGWDVVNSFKKGSFRRSYKFTVGLSGTGGA